MILKNDLNAFDCRYNAALSDYTFTRVGGPADILAFPHSAQELIDLTNLARSTATPLTVLGNASNLIVRDGGIRGLVILLDKLDQITLDGESLSAQAGAKLKTVSQAAQSQGLTGLEFACGIPGSIGGAVYMNAGAYGGEIANVLASAQALNLTTGELESLTNADLKLTYRHSLVQDAPYIVLSATFKLQTGDAATIQARMDELNRLRADKQPLEYPSCGSVFKRPEGYFAGRLINEAGCAGHRIGGVEVSTKHAGFMINVGGGTASDYEALIAYVIDKVREKSGVTLETEVRIIGEK